MIMNIKEQIRAEIERRKEELPEQDTHTTVGADSIRMAARYDDLLAFLDSLPEQPVSDHHTAPELCLALFFICIIVGHIFRTPLNTCQ
jgi:hypothetical protein